MLKSYLETALEVSKSDLRSGKRLSLRVNGQSMAPFLLPGDDVVVEGVTMDGLSLGDLIVVKREEDLVTHRLVGMGEDAWYVKGDNFWRLDPLVKSQSIIGKVVAVERDGHEIELNDQYWKRVNSFLGKLGWWETCLYMIGNKSKKRIFGSKAPHWTVTLAKYFMLPFRFPKWVLSKRRS